MRFSLRRRVFAALALAGVLGFLAIVVLVYFGIQLAGYYRNGYATCFSALQAVTIFSGCGDASTGFSPGLVWAEMIVISAVAAAVGWGLARWVTAPLATVATQLDGFGPNSLGLRLRPVGSARDEGYQLARAVDAMLDRVAEGYEAQRRFAANASHELRTPLATQRALIEVSLGSAVTADQLDLLTRQLLATNERNEALIEGLLVLAETENGLVHQSAQRLDLIAAGMTEALRPLADAQHVHLDVDLARTEVVGEAALLERLVTNLVHNAIKYNVANGRVCVQVRPDGVLVVTNTGPHVPPEQVGALFEPFRRARGDRLDHGGGVGLGLTIARSVVAAHHGAIEAYANPDGGMGLTVRLPLAR